MLRHSQPCLAKKISTAVRRKGKGKRKTAAPAAPAAASTPAAPVATTPAPPSDPTDLSEFVVKSIDGSSAAEPEYAPRKYVNERRADRFATYMEQQPRVEGAHVNLDYGYGMRAQMPHPTFDLSHEELQEYVEGTEYAELPEVVGKNTGWATQTPHTVEPLVSQTTGMEPDAALTHESFSGHVGAYGSEESPGAWLEDKAYRADDGLYDVDLTKPGAVSEWDADAGERKQVEYEMAHAHIATSPQFEAVKQMKWEGGRWVPHDDPNFKPASHPGFSVTLSGLEEQYAEVDVDLGDTGDGGYAKALSEFASFSQTSAGAEDDATQDASDLQLIAAREGNPLAPRQLISKGQPTRMLLSDSEARPAALPRTAVDYMDYDDGEDAAEAVVEASAEEEGAAAVVSEGAVAAEEAVAELEGGGRQFEVSATSEGGEASWANSDFLGLTATQAADTPDPDSVYGKLNGVAVDALDTTTVVDPQALTTEHEHHVFSGLYPREEGTEMTEFERERLARCLEQHQKMGVPLAYPGVDPFASNAFMRRKNAYNARQDDFVGRKHDLAGEFKLRQKLKLGHDVDTIQKPRWRLTEEGGSVHRLQGHNYMNIQQTVSMVRINPTDLRPLAAFPDGIIDDAHGNPVGERHWGTKYTSIPNQNYSGRGASVFSDTQGVAFDRTVTFTHRRELYVRNAAFQLETETRFAEKRERLAKEKEHAYKVRMGLVEPDPPAEVEPLPSVEVMRSLPPSEDELEMERMKVEEGNTYEMPAFLKENEDVKSTYGRNPWRTDVRYTAWKEHGTHWKDIDPERLQLRGTGYYDSQFGGTKLEDMGKKTKIQALEAVDWNIRPTERERLFKHYKGNFSTNNYLHAKGIDLEKLVPRVGPLRETVDDFVVLDDEASRPEWAYRPLQSAADVTGEQKPDVFTWPTKSGDTPVCEEVTVSAVGGGARLSTALKKQTRHASFSCSHGTQLGVMRGLRHGAAARNAISGRTQVLAGQRMAYFDEIGLKTAVNAETGLASEMLPADHLRLRDRDMMAEVAPAEWPRAGTAGVIVNVDGVLNRGSQAIPGVTAAVQALQAADIPMLFMNNGGAEWTEGRFAEHLSHLLHVPVSEDEVVLAARSVFDHTCGDLKDKSVLVVGPRGSVTRLREQGFTKAVGVDGVAQAFPHHVPSAKRDQNAPPPSAKQTYAFEAIVVAGEPEDWQSALQICIDVLTSSTAVGTAKGLKPLTDSLQGAVVASLDSRLVFAASHEVPRLGTGAFLESLKAVYSSVAAGRQLVVGDYGRMSPACQSFLESRLQDVSYNMGHTLPLSHVYSLTDNVHHDCAAACSYRDLNHRKWWSVLLGSGVTADGNTVVGVHTYMDLIKTLADEHVSIPDRERLRHYLQDRRADVSYASLPMFVADLLQLEYVPSPEEREALASRA
eukprot:Rhum_TRINITY_DN8609_c0_g1::Rhum_TRINITY_DN8609_c0_g1_i1::g.29061::m.29061